VLAPEPTWYWRVHATNTCGQGVLSRVFHFKVVSGLAAPANP
jgi:hypothetical protein